MVGSLAPFILQIYYGLLTALQPNQSCVQCCVMQTDYTAAAALHQKLFHRQTSGRPLL